MSSRYEKSWRRSLFKERDDKIYKLWKEGEKLSILCKRFGLTNYQISKILKAPSPQGEGRGKERTK